MNYALAAIGALFFIGGMVTGIGGCSLGGDYGTAGVCGWLAAVVGAVLCSAAHVADEFRGPKN